MSKLTIGNVTLDNNVILAPMAGVTDLPFRLLCREQGAGLVCMEMVSAKAIYYGNKNTEDLLTIHPNEMPASLQLFGSDPEILADMAKRIEDRPFAILDFNMGCPVPKVVNNGEGCALMKDPALVRRILTALVKAVKKPVTVKIRKGFDEAHCNAAEIARIAEDCGVAAIAVHGRTREQYYSGRADWETIARIKDAVSVPVIGNGDINGPHSALRMIEQTGCDGVMIGRAAQGNPWIFREIARFLEDGTIPAPPDAREKREMVIRHAKLQLEYKGEYTAVREMRKHLSWYTAGMPHSARFRQMINAVDSMEKLLESVDTIFGDAGIE
ncbi:MAG: tRNA dihydrouridine synthase DusB [Lachnospiraceae bacterium]|nr:tRNA dihydrouridine synthase DusB [Lachnospiraceae bacterium]MCM1239606.1 tRNA dihydrouridine synthase DusB [Lachnospiraceae bacterium]MCM1302744.1 tRNA dihydrouridine synthase DusB [Butyrivibrio sp.]MCM1342465.1 tRNA dihydrouridine synthase DusB [Muribaculaceae bacterium]MCM1410230.1 tRNA dihydrouridine synthase DusB [Lachnospiraceae bacterium]